MELPAESRQILRETLTASIEASDYNLQEAGKSKSINHNSSQITKLLYIAHYAEVEYSFQAGSLDDGQHIDQPILVQYADDSEAGGNVNACRKRKRAASLNRAGRSAIRSSAQRFLFSAFCRPRAKRRAAMPQRPHRSPFPFTKSTRKKTCWPPSRPWWMTA